MLRQLFNRSSRIDFLGSFSLIYGVLDVMAWLGRLDHQETAYLKLQFSGHIGFTFSKPIGASE